jgi:hypothetical protein
MEVFGDEDPVYAQPQEEVKIGDHLAALSSLEALTRVEGLYVDGWCTHVVKRCILS